MKAWIHLRIVKNYLNDNKKQSFEMIRAYRTHDFWYDFSKLVEFYKDENSLYTAENYMKMRTEYDN